MVGLYKDPDGKNITFNATIGEEKSISTCQSSEGDMEVKRLQLKITELEYSLRQRVSIYDGLR